MPQRLPGRAPASRARTSRARGVATLALALALLGAGTPALGAAAASPVPTADRTAGSLAGSAATAVRAEAARARAAYDEARERVDLIGAQRARLAEMAERAGAQATRLRDEVAAEDGGTLGSVLQTLSGDGSAVDRAAEAAADAEQAHLLVGHAEQALVGAIAEAERARAAYDEALAEQERLRAGWTAQQAAAAAARLATLPDGYDVADPAQDRRNRRALRRWQRYLATLGDASVLPPAATELAYPGRLPDGLDVARDAAGTAVPGVAGVDRPDGLTLTVLPVETVTAVSTAFGRLGLDDVPGSNTAATYACGGLPADAWGTTTRLPGDSVGQWRELHTVPRRSLQVGDVVVLGDRRDGLEQSGIYLGRRQAILADPQSGTAGVQRLPRSGVFGAKRIGLPSSRVYDAPAAGACGVEETSYADPSAAAADSVAPTTPSAGGDASALLLPVAAGSYRLSADFGESGSMWSSVHTGQDFAAPTGTDVVAAADGVVTHETPSWAGNLVRIDHGGGVETWYAHLSEVDVSSGQEVRRGERVGAVGSEGNSTGPHLHFEVRLDGDPVAPALALLIPEIGWPDHTNGEIPEDELCAATPDGLHRLRCDAAVSFRLLADAFATETGTELCLTDSYRSRDGQDRLYEVKPDLAAKPGTSVHGLGRAVDLCGGVERFGTPEHLWMVREGPRFGWVHPSWAAAGGSRPEPWHFEHGA